MTTPAQKRAQIKYDKSHTRSVIFKLNITSDADVLAKLDSVENRQGYIKEPIRQDLRGETPMLSIEGMRYLIRPLALKNNIKAIYLFGSYARGEATPESDVDIMIEGGNITTASEYFSLLEQIEKAFNKKVDLVMAEAALQNQTRAGKRLLDHIEKDKVVLYEQIQ